MWKLYPSLDMCSGHSAASEADGVKGAVVGWEEVPLPPGRLSPQQGTQLGDQSLLFSSVRPPPGLDSVFQVWPLLSGP